MIEHYELKQNKCYQEERPWNRNGGEKKERKDKQKVLTRQKEVKWELAVFMAGEQVRPKKQKIKREREREQKENKDKTRGWYKGANIQHQKQKWEKKTNYVENRENG